MVEVPKKNRDNWRTKRKDIEIRVGLGDSKQFQPQIRLEKSPCAPENSGDTKNSYFCWIRLIDGRELRTTAAAKAPSHWK
jgi:hypothetical protein